MKKLTFREYLSSKEELREALKQSPIRTATYQVKRYCRLPVGAVKESKEYVNLKPKQRLIIEWKYEDIEKTPEPVSVRFLKVKGVEEEKRFPTFWNGDRFLTWIGNNAREED